jgi:hypothetical protein
MSKVDVLRIFTLAGLLWFPQIDSVRANDDAPPAEIPDNSCTINSLQREGEMVAIADPPVELRGNLSVKISCRGSGNSRLRLTLNPVNVYNGEVRMQLVSSTGLLVGASNSQTQNTFTIPFSWQGDGSGVGMFRVDIVAPSGKLLRAATDYSLVVNATFD